MGSSAPSRTNATTTTDVPPWLKPYGEKYLSEAFQRFFPGSRFVKTGRQNGQDTYGWEGGQLAEYGGPDREILGFTEQELADRAGYRDFLTTNDFSQGLTGVQNLVDETIAGKYLDPNTNPHLRETYDVAAGDVTNQYQDAIAPELAAKFAQAGALGGTANANADMVSRYGLGQNLRGLASDIYGQNYQQERSRQMDAGSLAGSLTQLREQLGTQRFAQLLGLSESERQLMQQQEDVGYENELTRFEWPQKLLQFLGDTLGVSQGRASSTTSSAPNPNAGNDAATYGGLGIAGAAGLGLLNNKYGYTGP